jgi:hypothetical protein
MIYVYFYENIFQDNFINMIFTSSKLNNLKTIYDL